MIARTLERILGLTAVDAVYTRSADEHGDASIYQRLTDQLDLRAEIDPSRLAVIPRTGPVIVAANHPTGAMEGVLLPAILDGIRDDVKLLGHTWFKRWPKVAERMILVDPQAGETGREANRRAMREAAEWLRGGGMILVFPAGEVARLDPRTGRIDDIAWRRGLAHLARLTGALVLPMFISGRNSALYYAMSLLHPRLGALLLCRELLRQRGRSQRIRIGHPLRATTASAHATAEQQTLDYRHAMEALA